MKRTLSILMGLPAALGLCLLPAAALPVAGLQKAMAAGANVIVIDTRSALDYAQEHIPGAINIPAALCPLKNLPPLGDVVVYGAGLGADGVQKAAAALAAKPGIHVQILDGGYAGWKNSQAITTRRGGLRPDGYNYITYAHMKAGQASGAVLYDLRRPVFSAAAPQPLTDLNVEFPGLKHAKSRQEALQGSDPAKPAFIVLIDNGDGTAEREARQLEAGGVHNYAILAGGEMILARHGQAGLQRNVAGSAIIEKKRPAPATAN